jgi:hypothetical protein
MKNEMKKTTQENKGDENIRPSMAIYIRVDEF